MNEYFRKHNQLICKYLFADLKPIKVNDKFNPMHEAYHKPINNEKSK